MDHPPHQTSPARRAIVIGAGPAGLAAAEAMAGAGLAVTVLDAMPSAGRKFMMAGRGGLNLTHSEPLDAFLERYGASRERLEPALRAFPPDAMVAWSGALGQETFTGSSGRVFPRAMKASPLLRAWMRALADRGVDLKTRWRWTGWEGEALCFETPSGRETLHADAVVLALGGASWPRLGSDGGWAGMLAARGVAIAPFQPSNSGFETFWSEIFRRAHAGQPLKSARFSVGDRSARGEAIVTHGGLEGGAIYALSAPLRDAIAAEGSASLTIDLAPDLSAEDLARRLKAKPGVSMSNRLRKAGLSPVAAGLLRERDDGPTLPNDADDLAAIIKACGIRMTGVASMDRAISTAGGVSWESINADYSLTTDPNVFVCGEMLDWEAPTGGYLLQACMATGRAAGLGAAARVAAFFVA